jgi:hypothetical protein
MLILGGAVLLGAPELTGSLVGRQVFPPTNWWNLDISHAPLDPASASFIEFIGRTRQMHPDFGPPPYGIPYVVVTGDQPLVIPTWTAYGDESDAGAAGRPPGYPIPPEARTTADYIEGGVIGGGTSGDRHMLIVDKDHWLLYETGATRWNAAANRWGQLRRDLRSQSQRSSARDLDECRRRRSRDLSGAGSLRRSIRAPGRLLTLSG